MQSVIRVIMSVCSDRKIRLHYQTFASFWSFCSILCSIWSMYTSPCRTAPKTLRSGVLPWGLDVAWLLVLCQCWKLKVLTDGNRMISFCYVVVCSRSRCIAGIQLPRPARSAYVLYQFLSNQSAKMRVSFNPQS